MVICVSDGVQVSVIVGRSSWGIPKLFKKRSIWAGIVRKLNDTQEVDAAHPPEWRGDKGTQGPRAFVLLLMVLTRIPPPEAGFFLGEVLWR